MNEPPTDLVTPRRGSKGRETLVLFFFSAADQAVVMFKGVICDKIAFLPLLSPSYTLVDWQKIHVKRTPTRTHLSLHKILSSIDKNCIESIFILSHVHFPHQKNLLITIFYINVILTLQLRARFFFSFLIFFVTHNTFLTLIKVSYYS